MFGDMDQAQRNQADRVRDALDGLIKRQAIDTREAGEVVPVSSLEAFSEDLDSLWPEADEFATSTGEDQIRLIGDWRWGHGWDRVENIVAPEGVEPKAIIATRQQRCRALLERLRPQG